MTSSFSHLEKMSLAFMDIGRSAPRFESMALLYPHSHELQAYISEYFILVVKLCHDILKFKNQSSLGKFGSSLSHSFDKYNSELQSWGTSIKDEVQLQIAQRTNDEAEKNSYFRKVSTQFFKSSSDQHVIQARQRIFDFCCQYDYMVSWKQIRKTGNTNAFCDCPHYRAWKARVDCDILVYTGKLGAGKSVMLANMVDDLYISFNGLKQVEFVALFFARHDVSETLKARTVIGSIVQQILSQVSNLGPAAEILEFHSREGDFGQMVKLLGSVITPDGKIFAIIDGIDELVLEERETLLDYIYILQQRFHMSFCLSIRQQSSLQLEIEARGPSNSKVDIVPMPGNTTEIEHFVIEELERRVSSRKLAVGDNSLLLEIRQALIKGSQGMFLWVALQIESLCDMRTDGEIREALDDLPRDLSETFARILKRSDKHGKYPYQKWILELITVAQRQLTLEEMREALSVAPGEKEWNLSRKINDIHGTLALCGSLIIIDEEDFTLRLVHHSVKQFLVDYAYSDLTGAAIVDPTTAHRRMSDIIITYLHFSSFDTQVTNGVIPEINASSAMSGIIRSTGYSLDDMSGLALKVRKATSPSSNFNLGKTLAEARGPHFGWKKEKLFLQSYAKRFWHSHISWCLPLSPQIEDLFQKLYKRNAFDSIVDVEDLKLLLWRATEAGLVEFVQYLIKSYDIDINSELDSDGNSALHVALMNDVDDMVRSLLEVKDLNVKKMNNKGEAPMQIASQKGRLSIIKFFIDAGNVDHRASVLTPIICQAAKEGDEPLIERLIRYNEMKSTHSATIWRAIDAAVSGEKPEMVKLLLDLKSTPKFEPGLQGCNPLYTAVDNESEQMVQIILQSRKLNPINTGDQGPSALTLSAKRRHAVICRMICKSISEGRSGLISDEMGTDSENTSPYNIFGLEANPNRKHKSQSRDVDGNTALHLVAQAGYDDIVSLLLDINHSELNVPNNAGNMPLHLATINGHFSIVKLLANSGDIYLNAINNDGNTALHLAAGFGHLNTTKKLAAMPTAKLNVSNKYGDTPLHLATLAGHIGIIKVLLDLLYDGRSIDAQMLESFTLKGYQFSKHSELVRNMCGLFAHPPALKSSKGSDYIWPIPQKDQIPNSEWRDRFLTGEWAGMSPLHAAALVGSEEAIQVLLLDGADPFFLDRAEHTPLYYAFQKGHESIVKLLTKSSIFKSLYAQTKPENYEDDILNIAMASENLPMVACLLELPLSANLINARGSSGQTALHIAAETDNGPLLESLISKKPFINAENNQGQAPLHLSVLHGNINAAICLLANGALPSYQDSYGSTPLHYAAERDKLEIAESLISYDKNLLSVHDYQGRSPFHIASTHGSISTFAFLLSTDFSLLNVKDKNGLTPLDCAIENEHELLIELMSPRTNLEVVDERYILNKLQICRPN
ncbi:NACHT nucleoside triphosphatase [Penicillium angulare]|uniref:NACHT nucleoside triphosphatase n=1 Tax=Penicillium angulare TaxID=116970 RepID=A0A9W9FTK0_9EURO|nr:NACHT nucleoside triphosphatase [Penicillium angulare]